ncbi:hypothetical protein ACHAPJ_010772 [Fusarium lateritium]
MTEIDSSTSSNHFQRLPDELIGSICDFLPNSDIKNLRLASRFLGQKSRLRISRVFISAHPRNLDVVRAIADHETFRLGIEEIIWDDATLKPIEPFRRENEYRWFDEDEEEGDYGEEDEETIERQEMVKWYGRACLDSVKKAKHRVARVAPRPDTIARQHEIDNAMSYRESFKHFRFLESQQAKILETQADEDVFRHALQRFPRLRRVTVTPAAHGYLFEPLYQTPMIRSLPYGFIYPIPRGWPLRETGQSWPIAPPWTGNDATEEEKNQWRGFRIVTKILAEDDHHISELIFDSHQLGTGINHMALDQPTQEYKDLCKIIERPGFRHIQISLLIGYLRDDGEAEDWDTYRNGYLRNALAGAPNIEHVSLQTDYCNIRETSGGGMDDFVSLFDIFPIDCWTKVRHFGLSGMQVTQENLVSFLAKLPPTLRSVELSFLGFLSEQGHYRGLLEDIRDRLDWRNRPIDERIEIRVNIVYNQRDPGRYVCLDKEVQEYVYGDGPPPFLRGRVGDSCITDGTGTQKDEFNPHWERPYDSPITLRKLGY